MGSGLSPACAVKGAPGGEGVRLRAERCMGGLSLSPAGEARVGPGAHSCGVLPIAGLRRLRLDKRRRRPLARAERRRGGCRSSSRAKPGSGWEPVVGIPPHRQLARSRRSRGRRRLQVRERRWGGCRSSRRAKPGSGRKPVFGGLAHRQSARLKTLQGAKASSGKGGVRSPALPDEARTRPGAHSFGVGPSPGCVIEVAQAARASPDKGLSKGGRRPSQPGEARVGPVAHQRRGPAHHRPARTKA